MQRKDIKEALESVHSGSYSSLEETVAKYWLHQSFQDDEVELSKEEWLEIKHKIWADLETTEAVKPPKVKRLWGRIVSVAAAVALMGIGVYLFNYDGEIFTNDSNLVSKDVAPGKMGATLTLANGKKLRLSEVASGEIAMEAGIRVSKTTDGELMYEIENTKNNPDRINTLSTEKGETYILTLPDKSKVWLNAASSLTYSAGLNEAGLRRVKLEGEAFFQVTKDKKHPFVVQTTGQEVEVLGTHFNLSAYANESSTKTTLLEGSVKVSVLQAAAGKPLMKILKPNQQASLIGNEIKVADVVAEDAIAWKDGFFLFNQENLEGVMNKLSRWYNITAIYEDPSLKKETMLGTMSKYEQLSKVLALLERTGIAKFDIKGNVIYIKRK